MTNSGQQEEEKEELDFMDDSYLLQATHADQQRHVKSSRPSTAATSKSSQVQGSRKEREKIARDKGLSTSLLPARSGREGQHHIQGGSDKRINDGSEGELGSEGNRKGEGGEMTWAQKMVLKMMSGSSESSAASPSTNESKRSTSGFREMKIKMTKLGQSRSSASSLRPPLLQFLESPPLPSLSHFKSIFDGSEDLQFDMGLEAELSPRLSRKHQLLRLRRQERGKPKP